MDSAQWLSPLTAILLEPTPYTCTIHPRTYLAPTTLMLPQSKRIRTQRLLQRLAVTTRTSKMGLVLPLGVRSVLIGQP